MVLYSFFILNIEDNRISWYWKQGILIWGFFVFSLCYITWSFHMGFCKGTKHSFRLLTFLFWAWMLIPFMNLKPLLLTGKWEYNVMSYKLRWQRLEKLINRKHGITRIQLQAVYQIHHNSDQDVVSDQPDTEEVVSWRITVENSKNVSSSYPSLFQASLLLFSAKFVSFF